MLSLAQQLDSNLQAEDVETWLNVDRNDQGYELLSDEDIVKQVTEGDDPEVTEDDDDESKEVRNVPSSGEVKDMLDRCLLWYERQDECTATSLLQLKRI